MNPQSQQRPYLSCATVVIYPLFPNPNRTTQGTLAFKSTGIR
jgi:hypothetical protein